MARLVQPLADKRHTIILLQATTSRSGRTFLDYDSTSEAMDGICGLFEKRLRDVNPTLRNITYDITDLYKFIDSLADISALVFDPTINAYTPYDREWLKNRAFNHLKRLATR